MLPRHEHERAYRLHRQKLEMIKPSLDNNTPKQYSHLVYRSKSIRNEEEKLSQVDHENKILLNKMTTIMKSGGRVDNWNDQPTKRKVDPYKKQKHEKMLLENVQIAKRLESVKPTYDRQIWEGDYKRHEAYLEMRQENAKDPYYGTPPQRRKKGGEHDDYESDFESDDDVDDKDKSKGHQKSKKSEDKPLKKSPRDGEADLSMYWGDYKEQEDQDKKDSSRGEKTKGGSNKDDAKDKNKKNKKGGDEDNKNDLQSDRDVKQLFKVSKELLDEEESQDVLIKTLVKKSHKQRMETKAKFKEKYDLDLDKELKEGLGSDWNVIVDALLTEQDLADAENLHTAIQNQNTNSIIEIIGTKDNKSLSQLKDAYRKEYSKSVESAINEKYKDPIELFLVTISKTNKDESSDVDGKTAQKDAVELFESGDGRWTTASGKFIKLLDSKSISHTQTVLKLYKQVAGGKEALDTIKSECPSDYSQAVTSYVNCTKDSEGFYAEKLFRNIGHSNPEFVNTLVARSEIDMPAVCKTYKKKYDADLKEDIDDKCAEPTRKALKALASKSPKPKKGGDSKQSSKKGSGHSEGPTVKPDDNFNPDDDCERLRKAMDGLGTDEQTIIDIICSKDNAQRQTLKQKYAQKYKKRDLISDLKSELSGDFEEVILALMMPPDQYDVHCFHEAMSGAGTDESMLLTLLATKTPPEMKSIKSEYKKAYKKDLDKAIESDTSGDFRELLLALSKGDKPQGSTVNKKEAEEDAKKIHMDGKGKPDDEVFKNLMTKKNSAQIKATFAEYKKLSGKDIYDTMAKSLKGDAKDAYIALGKMCENEEATFYCDQLKEAADGMGTNDSKLIRIIVTRSEIDLATIKGKYKKKNKKTLNDMVDSECSGDYKKALLKIIGENQDEEEEDDDEEQTEKANDSLKKSKAKSTKTVADPATGSKGKEKPDSKSKGKMDETKGKGSDKTIQSKQKENKNSKSTKRDEKTNENKEKAKNKDHEKSKGKSKDNDKSKDKAKGDGETSKDPEKSIDDEVERLYKAMDGLGTDEQTIIDVIVPKKNQQRQDIRQKYNERYNKDVMSDLKSELSGDLQEVILGLMMTPSEYDVDCLHEAMSGMGTDESMLIGILATRTPEVMKTLKDQYKTEYKKDLEKDIKSETSGDFKELLLELVKGQRPQGDKVDDKISEEEAKKLNKNGKGKLDKKHFKSIFNKYNNKQVPAIFEEYKKISDKNVLELIEENMKGDVKNGYICLVKSYDDPVEYYVERLHDAFDGIGTNDSRLIRILVSRSEIDLPGTKEKYKESYGKSLNKEIKSECSGDYKTALLLLIGEDDDQANNSNASENKDKFQDSEKSKDDEKPIDNEKLKDVEKSEDEKYIDDEVERLYKAMDGLGTDEQTIIDVIVRKKNQQRQEIRQKYNERYKKNVMSDLKSELSGDLQEVILGLMMTPSEYDVDCLHEAMSGMGTDESMLIGILATRTPEEMKTIKDQYKTEYKKDLEKDIKSETSGDFKELLLELVKGQRPQGDKVEDRISEDEAKKLNKNGKGKLDKKHFKSIFNKYNNKQVPAIFKEYKKISDKNVLELIEENMKGDVKSGYICLVKSYDDPVEYYVERLHDAFDGIGTNDSRLIRILVSRSEIDLPGIKDKYKESYGKSLNEEIKPECSGDYKTALLLLIGEDGDQANNSNSLENKDKFQESEKPKDDEEPIDDEKSEDEKYIDDEVERLYKAMDGLGTDEQTIIDVIVPKKNQQRQEIRQKYNERYNKDVMSDLKSELSGDLQEVILGLMMTPSEYDVDCLHEAMSGMGTDESMLIGIIATRTPEELKNIKQQYRTEYKKDLEKDIKSETSGDFKELLLELVKGQRPQCEKVEDRISEDEAKKLNKNGKGKLDKKHFQSIFTKYNNKQVPAIFEEYKKTSEKDVLQLIEENMKGDVKNGYTCLVKSYDDPVEYYVERLHDAFDGIGTNDSRLIRILVSRSEIDLAGIKEKYKESYGKSLNEEIKSECSGDYKTALLLLIGEEDEEAKDDETQKAEDTNKRKGHTDAKTEKDRSPKKAKDINEAAVMEEADGREAEVFEDLPDEVDRLYKAMDGIGTDERTIIYVIVTKTNQQRQDIRRKYKERFKKDVMSDLKSELSGDLQEVILGLMMTPSEYDVDCLHEAMSGMGTDESMLIGILATRTPNEIKKIKELYKKKYKKDLEKDIKSETTGDFKELLLELVKVPRPQGDEVDEKVSETEAMRLYKNSKTKLDMKQFKNIFTKYNGSQVKAIFDEYEKLYEKTCIQIIDENVKSDSKPGYKCLVTFLYEDPVDYYVERLHDAFDGIGTNDFRLIRILVSRSEIDLVNIKTKYKESYGKSLHEEIKSECSGDYKTALLLLIGEDSTSEYTKSTTAADSLEDSSKEKQQRTEAEAGDYDAMDDCRILWKAMDGFGTNEDDIIKILGNRNKHQRQEIIKTFKSKYKKDLIKELKSELSGKLLETTLALMTDPLQYDVKLLHGACSGFSTDNRMVFHIVGTKSRDDLIELDKAYKTAYKKTLKDLVTRECKGVVQKLLFKILSSAEQNNDEYQNKSPTELVTLLYNDGKPIFKTDPELVYDILSNYDDLTSLFEEFSRQTDKTFIDSLKQTFSGDDECVMLAFVSWLNGPVKYYSTSLCESMAGLGTNNSLLIHILISRSEIDLKDIKEEFKETYGKNLEDCVEKECSGDYKNMLLTVINKQ